MTSYIKNLRSKDLLNTIKSIYFIFLSLNPNEPQSLAKLNFS